MFSAALEELQEVASGWRGGKLEKRGGKAEKGGIHSQPVTIFHAVVRFFFSLASNLSPSAVPPPSSLVFLSHVSTLNVYMYVCVLVSPLFVRLVPVLFLRLVFVSFCQQGGKKMELITYTQRGVSRNLRLAGIGQLICVLQLIAPLPSRLILPPVPPKLWPYPFVFFCSVACYNVCIQI